MFGNGVKMKVHWPEIRQREEIDISDKLVGSWLEGYINVYVYI